MKHAYTRQTKLCLESKHAVAGYASYASPKNHSHMSNWSWGLRGLVHLLPKLAKVRTPYATLDIWSPPQFELGVIAEMVNSISVVCLCRVSNHVGTQGIIIFWDINMPIFKAWLNINDILQCCFRHSLYSSVAERQSCKLKVLGSIPSEGFEGFVMSRRHSKWRTTSLNDCWSYLNTIPAGPNGFRIQHLNPPVTLPCQDTCLRFVDSNRLLCIVGFQQIGKPWANITNRNIVVSSLGTTDLQHDLNIHF